MVANENTAPSIFPGLGFIQTELAELNLPPLAGDVIYIASDIGPEQRRHDFVVYTALYASLYGSAKWETGRRQLRHQFLGDGRRMSYKRLGDRQRREALPGFLEYAGHIDGVLLSLAFPRKEKTLWAPPPVFHQWRATVGMEGRWKALGFERLVRMANIVTMLIGSLGRDGQHSYWISDQDSMFSNPAYVRDAKRLVERLSSIYIRHRPGELGLGTVEIDEGDRVEEDLSAVCDLVAGALSEICTDIFRTVSRQWNSLELHWKAQEIGAWIACKQPKLKVLSYIIEQTREGQIGTRRLDLEPSRIHRP